MTKSTLRRMGTRSQSLSRPASVSTPPQLFHIKAVNCDFTVGVLHNCFTNQEGGLLSPTLCQQENGGKKAICKTWCVLMNMQIDGHTTLVAAKTV